MAVVVVRHRLLTPDGEPVRGQRLVALLVASAGFLADHSAELVDSAAVVTGEDGRCELRLTPQTVIAESGTHYLVQVQGTDVVHTCVVPSSGPVQLADIVVDPDTLNPAPPGLASLYVPRAERGQPGGWVPLGDEGLIGGEFLPAGDGDDSGGVDESQLEYELYQPGAAGFTEWTVDPQACSADFPHNNGVLLMMRFRYRGLATTISEIGFGVTSAASGPGAYSGVALYADGDGEVERLGQSVNAGAQWTSQGSKSVALATPVPVVRGAYYRATLLWQGSGAGRIAGAPLTILASLLNAGANRSTFLAGQTGFPSTLTVSGMSTNNATYLVTTK